MKERFEFRISIFYIANDRFIDIEYRIDCQYIKLNCSRKWLDYLIKVRNRFILQKFIINLYKFV